MKKTEKDKNEYKKYRMILNREPKSEKEECLEIICSSANNYLSKGLSGKTYNIINQHFKIQKCKARVFRGKDGKWLLKIKKNCHWFWRNT